jgi:hypothetical protein
VNAAIKALYRRARAVGFGPQVLSALKELDRILTIYPQYGEPLRDLKTVGETVYVATFPPLYVEYIIDEPRRSVFIIADIRAMPHSGFK